MKELNVLYQFNDKYAPYAGVSITSLLMHNTSYESINIYLMLENVSDKNINKLKKVITDYNRNVIIVNTDELVVRMKELGMPKYRDSYAANMRLFIADYLPQNVERLIYIDSDTIIIGSLSELNEIDLDGKILGMVCDSVVRNYRKRIGFSEFDDYYNSGVIVYDVLRWKQNNGTERILNHIKNIRNTYVSPDQDLLNIVFKNQIKRLPIKYNLQPIHKYANAKVYLKLFNKYPYYSYNEIKEGVKEAIILHCFRFAGEFPWNQGNVHPMEREFDSYLSKSYWMDYQKEKKQIGLLMKIEKTMYKYFPQLFTLTLFSIAHERYILDMDNKILKNLGQEKNERYL